MTRARYVGQSERHQGRTVTLDMDRFPHCGVGYVWARTDESLVALPFLPWELVLERGPHLDATDEATYRTMMRRLARSQGRDLA